MHLGATTLPSRIRVIGTLPRSSSPLRRDPSRFPQVPFQHSRSRVATLVQARRTIYRALRRPDCTLNRLFALVAEEDDQPVTESIATPETNCPPWNKPKLARALSVVATPGNRRSCLSCGTPHLNIVRFHQPCLLPWRTPYCHRNTAGFWAGTSEDCHPRTTWRPLTLFGQPGSFSFANWRFLPCRPDGTTAKCYFILLPLRVPPPHIE